MGTVTLTLSDICPDCQTRLSAPHGPELCETCWRIVLMTVRDKDGAIRPVGRWMRLPVMLQGVPGLKEALLGPLSKL